eukprot:1140053-Pelagomonas_calceolata.AAC.3
MDQASRGAAARVGGVGNNAVRLQRVARLPCRVGKKCDSQVETASSQGNLGPAAAFVGMAAAAALVCPGNYC